MSSSIRCCRATRAPRSGRRRSSSADPSAAIDRVATVNRRDQVAQSLKELEAREKARNKVTLEGRIAQAGLTWTKRKFFIVSAVAALALGLALLVISGNPIVAAAASSSAGSACRAGSSTYLQESPHQALPAASFRTPST